MLTRRGLITSGAGLVLAARKAAAGPLDLPAALPEGARGCGARRAARQEAADQAQLSAAELRDADRIFPHRDHAERCVLRPLPPVQHSGGRCQDLEACGRRRRRERPGRAHPRDLKKMPAVEVVAVNLCSGNRRGLFQPHVPGVDGATARWAAPAGRARGSRTSRQGRGEERAIEIVFDGADGPSSTRRPTSSRAFRSGRRWRRPRSSPTR